MDSRYPISAGKDVQDGAKANPTLIIWGDPVWDAVVGPVLDAVREALADTARGGPIVERVVAAWKSGKPVGSNKDLAEELCWDVGDVAEGFRLVRERMREWQHPAVQLRLREYTRALEVTPRTGVRTAGDLLLSIGGRRADEAGSAMAGALPAARGRGLRVYCEQPRDAEEQARVLDAGAYAGYLVLPVDETDDFGVFARLEAAGGRVALLDLATRNSRLPCVTFDYAGAGLYCSQQLIALGCQDVVLLARENDSRTFAMAEGCRRAVRRAGLRIHRLTTVDGTALDALCRLQEQNLMKKGGTKLGLLCADGVLGEEVLRFLDGAAPHEWNLAVAVVGGRRWAARHWAELVWVELDFAELAAAGVRYLLGTHGHAVPRVTPRYEQWVPRKPAGSAGDTEQETWRPVKAG
ncbi:MAG TPA: hypothetical protein VFQ91_14210 [Bryobacteraceae bacterium]|nr:hypothetical protein [Bryobacteraceae bacterium]